MKKIGAWVVAILIALGGMVLMAGAGIMAVLITDPIYPFLPVYLPLALATGAFVAFLMGRVPFWFFADHPDRRRWGRVGQGLALLGMLAWGYGIYVFCTMPMHWQ
ncbi:hypothetical protein [Dongia sp.]|uniref:hypothetical protein n=1 Tax=Dongia sp. TaxID=1977262 RepID=UPI0035AF78BE